MKKVNWESVMNQLDDDLLQDALSGYGYGGALPSAKEKEILKMKKNHHFARRLGAIAAAVALIFTLGITAYATNLFGILDMDVTLDANPTAEVISITGYQDSAEYKASVEWQNYLDKAEKNGTNEYRTEQEIGNYRYYNAFSHEAKDALDALLDKYGLRMYENRQNVVGQKELYEAVGTSGFLPTSAGLAEIDPSGNVIDGKSIYSYCDSADLFNSKNVPYDLFRLEKGTFIYTGFLWGNVSNFEEWTYVTRDGTSVILCLGEIQSIIMADLGSSFVLFNIRTGSANNDPNRSSYGRDTLTKSDLEEFADMFGFAAMRSIG